MAIQAWVCETCNAPHKMKDIWVCPGCGKETCNNCFDRSAHCKNCTKRKTNRELQLAANKKGWDFKVDPIAVALAEELDMLCNAIDTPRPGNYSQWGIALANKGWTKP